MSAGLLGLVPAGPPGGSSTVAHVAEPFSSRVISPRSGQDTEQAPPERTLPEETRPGQEGARPPALLIRATLDRRRETAGKPAGESAGEALAPGRRQPAPAGQSVAGESAGEALAPSGPGAAPAGPAPRRGGGIGGRRSSLRIFGSQPCCLRPSSRSRSSSTTKPSISSRTGRPGARRLILAAGRGWYRWPCGPTSCSSCPEPGCRGARWPTWSRSPTSRAWNAGGTSQSGPIRPTAGRRRPADPAGVLPHYPMVTHRGGYPDGS